MTAIVALGAVFIGQGSSISGPISRTTFDMSRNGESMWDVTPITV